LRDAPFFRHCRSPTAIILRGNNDATSSFAAIRGVTRSSRGKSRRLAGDFVEPRLFPRIPYRDTFGFGFITREVKGVKASLTSIFRLEFRPE
jgi:hypothetical protein